MSILDHQTRSTKLGRIWPEFQDEDMRNIREDNRDTEIPRHHKDDYYNEFLDISAQGNNLPAGSPADT